MINIYLLYISNDYIKKIIYNYYFNDIYNILFNIQNIDIYV
jgi:hypothetical protein